MWIYLKSFLLFLLVLATFGAIGYAVTMFLNIDFKAIFENPEDLENLGESPIAIALGILAYVFLFLIWSIIMAYFSSTMRNYRYNLTTVGNRATLQSNVTTWPLAWLTISNLLLLIFTLGIAFPWVKVRNARFFARRTTVYADGPLDKFAADEQEKVSSIGDELGEAFDLDLDIGI